MNSFNVNRQICVQFLEMIFLIRELVIDHNSVQLFLSGNLVFLGGILDF